MCRSIFVRLASGILGAGLLWFAYQPGGGFAHAIAGVTMLAGAVLLLVIIKDRRQ